MTYQEIRAAMQLISDLDVGIRLRAGQRQKDQRFAASVAAVKADEGR